MTNACTVSTPKNTYLELLNPPRIPQTDVEFSFTLPTPFQLEYGVIATPLTIQARIVGAQDAPVILAMGGISANRHTCQHVNHAGKKQGGWWQDIVGPYQAIDTNRFRVLSFDFIPGEADHLSAVPHVTTADQARIAAVLCDFLEIPKLYAFVGASYGGMIALNFARLFPKKVGRLVMLCASHRAHPMGVAWRSIQRKIVQFGLDTEQPDRAISLARELGMTTYRTAEEFGSRFSSQTEVKNYLENRGQEFVGRMSPARYLKLSESIDLHQVNPQEVHVPTALIGFRQDQLVPINDLRYLAQQLPKLTHYFETDSIYGHDAFLKELPFLTEALGQSLTL
jgi:homoserine O-acetyltransferase